MKPPKARNIVVPRSLGRGLKFTAISFIIAALFACFYLSKYYIPHLGIVLLVFSFASLIQGTFEITGTNHLFSITDTGFDDQNPGGIGPVKWSEVHSFTLTKFYGQDILAFRPRKSSEFWKTRKIPRYLLIRIYCLKYGKDICVSWNGWASSACEGKKILDHRLLQSCHL